MRGLVQKALGFTLGLLMAIGIAQAASEIEGLKFSQKEIELLKRLDQIQTGAGIATSMLKASPFVQLFGAPEPMDVAITVGTNDWDLIFGALTALKKIQACKTVEEIDLWKEVDGNDYSSSKSDTFFTEIRSKANASC